MPSPHLPTDCDYSCLAFADHARHFCCKVCHPPPPPSPASTVEHCPECRSPADLPAALEGLAAEIRDLYEVVLVLSERLALAEESEGEE